MTKLEMIKKAESFGIMFVNCTAEQYAKKHSKTRCERFLNDAIEWANKKKENSKG